MGLDNFFYEPEKPGVVEGDFKICGGMLSGHGTSSFRGKVYEEMVSLLTGYSLYAERVDADELIEIANDLEASGYENAKAAQDERYGLEEKEFNDLIRMFRLHGEAGHHMVSWY